MRKKLLAFLSIVALLLAVVPNLAQGSVNTANLQVSGASGKSFVYIVQRADAPVVGYDGGIPGYQATRPAKGQKIDPRDAKVVKYAAYLDAKHTAALRKVGGGSKLYDYHYTYNGFAARLTEVQAAALAKDPGVVAISKDEKLQPDTSGTPTFLGLDAAGGLWEQLGGVANAGEGVIVGIVDTGIWPESSSFSDRDANGKRLFRQIPGWHGKCTPGEQFPASNCNQKLIGAQWFNQGFGGNAAIKTAFPYEYASARDADGHGTHTASTAAGNYGIEVTVGGAGLGTISGMAPRARVSSYKVCWGRGGEGGCFSSDSVAAIDQAVADGVDVINFSISGSTSSFLAPVEVAFLFAADAGVFVAASAGNSGPGASTVAHNSPWLTTVAAGTHDRGYLATVTLGNDDEYEGVSVGSGTDMVPLLLSSDAGLDGEDPDEVTLCYPGTLDPAKVAGKIVVCDRGVIARVDKSLAVQMAGGVGAILANTSAAQSLNADVHYVPTVHVTNTVGAAIKAYAGTAENPTAQLSPAYAATVEAPFVAAFSSRGPAVAGGGDLLKPDILAPGVDVLAAVSPAGYAGANWSFLSGTSMSSPHVAGLGALMKHRHPDWSPAMIKSALMTTAGQTTNMGNPLTGNPFRYGAGHVTPNAAANPGLVYDSGWIDWLGFLCGTGQLTAWYCPSITIDPSDLNYPSVAIGALAGMQTVTRTVTNVGSMTATYEVTATEPSGVTVDVVPSTLTLAPGESATYEVTFTVQSGATVNSYVFGSLTWSDGTHSVRSPIAVRPVSLAAPGSVSGMGTDGSANYNVTFGYEGDFAAVPHGLIPATMEAGNVVDDPANDFDTALDTEVGITVHAVSVPAGTQYLRFSLFDEYTDGEDDLDLYIFRPDLSYYGGSGSGTSAEQVNVTAPTAGTWYAVVHGWQTDGPDANYTLFSWALGEADAGNMTVTAPTTATLAGTESVNVAWSGLVTGNKYLGTITYHNVAAPSGYNDGRIGTTIVRIDTDSP